MADPTPKKKQTINLEIGGMSYPYDIDADDKEQEEVYRLAAREVNAYLGAVMQKRYKDWKKQDYLALTALKFACDLIYMRRDRELGAEELCRLEELAERLDAYLNTPESRTRR